MSVPVLQDVVVALLVLGLSGLLVAVPGAKIEGRRRAGSAESGTNTLSGKIVNCETQVSISGAKIRVIEPVSGLPFKTPASGFFRLELPAKNSYKLRVLEPNAYVDREFTYQMPAQGNVEMEPICLQPKPGSVIIPGPPLSTIVYFPENSSDLSSQSKTILDDFINQKLQEDPKSFFVVDSHQDSDELPNVTGDRATTVSRYLMGKAFPGAVTTRRFYATCPAASGNDNRRVEVWALKTGVNLSVIEDGLECAAGAAPRTFPR
jgi:outer membrane protein OmpA-like peptidoglycan-associated protein